MGMSYVIDAAKNLSQEDKTLLYGNVLLFLFKGQVHQELSANLIRAGIEFDVHYFRLAVQRNGLLMRDGKAWVYAKFHDVPLTGHALTRRDMNALSLGMFHLPLRRRLKALSRLGRKVFTLAEYDEWVRDALNARDVVLYARSEARRKLRFLVNYGMCMDNMYSDLIHAGLLAVMKDFPNWENFDHLKKSAKASIHNRARNIIEEQTSAKRQAMETDKDGNSLLLKTSYDVIADMPAYIEGEGFTTHSHLSVGITGDNRNFETLSSLRQLTSAKSSLKPLQRRYLTLLLGEFDEDFSIMLGSNNTEAFERMEYSRYVQQVQKFLCIPQEAATKFLASLRQQL